MPDRSYGCTVDVILINGELKENDTLVMAGLEGPIVTQARSLLMPEPLKELRVKNSYVIHKQIVAAQGVKIAAKDLDKAVAGLPMFVAESPDEIEYLSEKCDALLDDTLNAIRTVDKGVSVQASTLGSLEALMDFLKHEKIPVAKVNIGPIHKRDVTSCSIQLQKAAKYGIILGFDVPVDREAQLMADREGVRIFTADIIYHLENNFRQHMKEVAEMEREKHKYIATFPCRLEILPDCVFNARDPIVVGVKVLEGQVKVGTPIVVPSKEMCDLGVISSIQVNNEDVLIGKKGEEVCIKIEPRGDKKMYGRQFDFKDILVSKVGFWLHVCRTVQGAPRSPSRAQSPGCPLCADSRPRAPTLAPRSRESPSTPSRRTSRKTSPKRTGSSWSN